MRVLLPSLFLLFGGIIGYYLKSLLEKRNERESRKFNRKEEQYKKFLKLALESFFEGWRKSGKDREFLEELNTNALLYASDEVLRKAYEFLYCFDGSKTDFPKDKSDKYYRELVILMRKELMKLQGDKMKLKAEELDIRKVD